MQVASGRRTRVLVVEDHDDSRDSLVRILRRQGHEVHSSATLADGLGELITWLPECVVLDLMLPDGLGVQLLRNVREHAFPARVVVITAASDPKLLAEVDDLKPDAIFRKPLKMPDLLGWIEHAA
jgi:DNA-binding response OmpR family regulator